MNISPRNRHVTVAAIRRQVTACVQLTAKRMVEAGDINRRLDALEAEARQHCHVLPDRLQTPTSMAIRGVISHPKHADRHPAQPIPGDAAGFEHAGGSYGDEWGAALAINQRIAASFPDGPTACRVQSFVRDETEISRDEVARLRTLLRRLVKPGGMSGQQWAELMHDIGAELDAKQ